MTWNKTQELGHWTYMLTSARGLVAVVVATDATNVKLVTLEGTMIYSGYDALWLALGDVHKRYCGDAPIQYNLIPDSKSADQPALF